MPRSQSYEASSRCRATDQTFSKYCDLWRPHGNHVAAKRAQAAVAAALDVGDGAARAGWVVAAPSGANDDTRGLERKVHAKSYRA